MNRATVVCCYNDEQQFNELKEGLSGQSEQVDIIGIRNVDNAFSSCAAAFNSIINDIKTDYVIYSHQDIRFEDVDNIRDFVDYLERITDKDVLGVAGVRENIKQTYTNIYGGIENKRYNGKFRVNGLEKCFSFDECFYGGHTVYFRNNPYDEVICNNWHLYAVEQGLRAAVNGGSAYMCDICIYHHSEGAHNVKLHENFRDLCKAYADKYEYICTPCCRGETGVIRRNWGYVVRNAQVGVKPSNRVARAVFKRLKKLDKKSALVHNILVGKRIFK